MKISITSPQEKVTLQIAQDLNITDMQEYKFAYVIVSKVMAMYEDSLIKNR